MKQDDEFIGKIRQVLGGDLSLLNKREMVELNKRAKNYIEAVEREAVKLNNKWWIEEIEKYLIPVKAKMIDRVVKIFEDEWEEIKSRITEVDNEG